ncbi:Hypothetical protein NTJ_01004 [Nesidiocoris tenuis]|uniref:Uncharacterized protein n=1 Tax=Nesidiocoris tenuis TaxID=355587 RepID=A0ABN7A7F4_9HEMI|nr:Hypothetical protein NTJ_01004 [Nesidiocoris tenuis]
MAWNDKVKYDFLTCPSPCPSGKPMGQLIESDERSMERKRIPADYNICKYLVHQLKVQLHNNDPSLVELRNHEHH